MTRHPFPGVFTLIFPVLLSGLLFFSCAQDAIFAHISDEPPPKNARIPGSPTNMAVIGDTLYAGTMLKNRVQSFSVDDADIDEDGDTTETVWVDIASPDGVLLELAGTSTKLYALTASGADLNNTVLKEYDTGVPTPAWTSGVNYPGYSLESLYTAHDQIFVGARSGSDYIVLEYTGTFTKLIPDTTRISLLSGAAYNGTAIYLSAGYGSGSDPGNGIFKLSVSTLERVQDGNMMGITAAGSVIYAVSSNGQLYSIPGGASLPSVGAATGALAVWENPADSSEQLLLIGIKTSRYYSNGYREMTLDGTNAISIPGDKELSSIKNGKTSMYNASIGRRIARHILQVPEAVIDTPDPLPEGWERPVFVSTANVGLWSYRNEQWNAED